MSAVRRFPGARYTSALVLAAVVFLCAIGVARADETPAARARDGAKRNASSLGLTLPNATSARSSLGFSNGFIYTPGPQPTVGIRGRLNVGRSGVYVPYYGNIGDPNHPGAQGVAGIGYGFGSWDVSVMNASGAPSSPVVGVDPPKTNLQFSIRF